MRDFLPDLFFSWPKTKKILDKLPVKTIHEAFSNGKLTHFEKRSQEIFQNLDSVIEFEQGYDNYKDYFTKFVNNGHSQSGITLPKSNKLITGIRFAKLMVNLSKRVD